MLRSALIVLTAVCGAWHLHLLRLADLEAQSAALCRHDRLDLPDASDVPAVELNAERDAVSGWNLRIQTDRFRFAPEHASEGHVPGEGHAHLFVDGQKAARLYAPWYHLPSLTPGRHEIRVTLNTNDHRDLASGGRLIEAVIEVRE